MTDMSGGPDEIAALLGPCWSETRTATAFGVSVEDLTALRESGGALGLLAADGLWVYPVDQFQRHDGCVRVNAGLSPVFWALRGHDPWAVAVLLHTPAPELEGATPLGWLSAGGDPEAVAALAVAVAHEWAAGSTV